MAESTFDFFSSGSCRVCKTPVRGTANRNRHLRRHAGDGLVTEVSRSQWSATGKVPDATKEVIDLMVVLQKSLKKGGRKT